MALGYAEWKAGKKDDADRDMREGLESLREGMTPGHPETEPRRNRSRFRLPQPFHCR